MTLSDWKSALEGAGVGSWFEDDGSPFSDLWFATDTYCSRLYLNQEPDASFREAVMEHVWGERSHFVPVWGLGMDEGWLLFGPPTESPGFMLQGEAIASGPTKNEALYNALLAEGARRKQ